SSGSSTTGATSSSSAPAQLTVWRMGASVPSEVTWMNGVVAQFHKDYPAYAKTQITVKWIPWTNATADWTNALASGKNAPDITELGNTDTPTEASLGVLANVSSYVDSWSAKPGIVTGMLANDTQNGDVYAVPWFGGVRGVWYRTDQFKAAGIASPPTTWAQLATDAQKLMAKYPGTYGIDAITDDTNAFASFVWGAGGQIATQSNGTWTADLTSPADEAAIKFYVSLYTTDHLSPSKYIGQTELGNTGSTSGGANTDFGLGKLDLYIDGPWATATMPANSTDKSNWASFPIPSENGPTSAPVFAGGSDLAIFKTSKYQQADWDLISVMDNTANSTSFANLQGFFPPYTAELTGGVYKTQKFMSGFATAAANSQVSPLNAKNWPTADNGKYYIIPDMLKSLMNGAPFASTVASANSQLQTVLNTGTES
ncbi:MAG TPA: extracellular solute-binding protein, partial [Streptosporangiaceae bacterium]|nr:extracellular solute-binding protein [Streptosporangiaceae bacterium]